MDTLRFRAQTVEDAATAARLAHGDDVEIVATRMVAAPGLRGLLGLREVEVTVEAMDAAPRQASVRRLTQAHPTLVPVHGPIHASWLNQIEIYFSIIQRKVLTPNDFPCLEAVAERLANFERHFESIAHPFEWKFTRADLNALIARMRERWARCQPLKLAA